MEALRLLALVGQVLFSLAAVLLVCLLVRTYLVGPYCRKLHVESKGNKEILDLGVSAFTFLMLTVTPGLSACTWLGQGSLAHAAHGWRMRHCFHVCAVALTLPAGVPACLSCTPYT